MGARSAGSERRLTLHSSHVLVCVRSPAPGSDMVVYAFYVP